MEEKRNNGQGIFLGIMGVATLVVTLIGATFAYFSASATNNTTIKANTASASNLTLEVTKMDTATGGLIPMANSLASKAVAASCLDSNGNTVCHVYQIKLTNGPSPIKINGTLSFSVASGVTNIVYNVPTKDVTSTSTLATLSAVSGITTGTAYSTAATLASNSTFTANQVKYYYVVVWLKETSSAQDSEAGKSNAYVGTVSFNAVGSNGVNGVTATFTS